MSGRPRTRTLPQPGELWLGCPPYLLVARIIEVDDRRDPSVVTSELYDENGYLLEEVSHAALDDGWWRAFQPLTRRRG
jgi:hypothetical protein